MVRELEHGSISVFIPGMHRIVEAVVYPVREVVVLLVVKRF